ncbi:MAG: outer membrane beta-barrel protein [Bacteroidetes bacterium]|nr:outer membrane beta-barrel protein [Bacteroidota bacterium]
MKYVYGLITLALIIFLSVESSSAQSRKGFEVGIGPSLLVASGDGESDSGFGAHLTLAYGIGERFTIGINGAAGIISDDEVDDDVTASVGGIFGRYYFGSPESLGRAYFTFGGGQGSFEAKTEGVSIEVSGPSGMIGAGYDYMRAGSRLGFFGEVNYNVVNFDEVTVGGFTIDGLDVDVDYIVIAAGLRFRLR